MFEFISLAWFSFLAFLVSPMVLGGMLLCSVFVGADTDDREYHLFTQLLFNVAVGYIVFELFHMNWDTVKYFVWGYIPFGFLWSFYRFDRYARNVKRLAADSYHRGSKTVSEYITYELTLTRVSGKIVNWVINWPMSIVSYGLVDIAQRLKDLVEETFAKIYNKIASRYIE